MSLNVKQQQAVEHLNGQLLILAGAGSGKTTVLMNRIANMIHNGIPPWNILAVTFTNKAATEMRERIEKHIDTEQAQQVHMSTFHSLCLEILKREWKNLSIFDKRFDISEPNNSSSYIRGIIKGKTRIKPSTVLGYISALKNEMVDAQSYNTFTSTNPYIDWIKVKSILQKAEPEHLSVLEWAYPAYEKIMQEKNFADFDDLILLTVNLFLSRPDILAKYQNKYRYIMVDEYQDTNRAQYVLIRLLADKEKNLAVVGDDFQSIYSFRGSDIRNILNFDKDYPECTIVKLEQNYRSTQNIIEAANQVISKNLNQKNKKLFTENPIGEKVSVVKSDLPTDSAEHISQTILDSVLNKKRKYEDFTVLFRNNSMSADIETSFTRNKIPYLKLSGRSFFDLEEIQDIIKYLEFIDNPNNLNAFSRVIRKPKRRIAEKTIKKIEDEFYEENLLTILDDLSYIEYVQKKAIQEGKDFAKLIRKYQLLKDKVSVTEIINGILEDIDYTEKILSTYDSEKKKEKLENIEKLIEMIVTQEYKSGKKVYLTEYIEEIMLYNADGETSTNAVKLMTIHGSKGLEFPEVFVIGMNEESFPAFYAESAEDIEEERRMCYVAFTRAKEKLHLSLASKRMLKNGSKKFLMESRFVNEFDYTLKDLIY